MKPLVIATAVGISVIFLLAFCPIWLVIAVAYFAVAWWFAGLCWVAHQTDVEASRALERRTSHQEREAHSHIYGGVGTGWRSR